MKFSTSRTWFILCALSMLGTAQAKVVTVTAYSNGFNGSLGGTTGLSIDGRHNKIDRTPWPTNPIQPQEGSAALWISLVRSSNVFTSPSFTVKPNTTYNFSYYATRRNNVAPVPKLQVKINNQIVVGTQQISQVGWRQHTGRWNSGNATKATIQVEALQLGPAGNDFGIDNITLTTQEDQAPPKKTLKVKATDSWLDTGIDVKPGQRVVITATGKWKNDGKPETYEVTADGFSTYKNEAAVIPGANFASLIGRFGKSGAPFFVGSNYEGTGGSGRLFLQMNDIEGFFPDNVGELKVHVVVK